MNTPEQHDGWFCVPDTPTGLSLGRRLQRSRLVGLRLGYCRDMAVAARAMASRPQYRSGSRTAGRSDESILRGRSVRIEVLRGRRVRPLIGSSVEGERRRPISPAQISTGAEMG